MWISNKQEELGGLVNKGFVHRYLRKPRGAKFLLQHCFLAVPQLSDMYYFEKEVECLLKKKKFTDLH